MKVAFITSEPAMVRYDGFYTAVRSIVGTTEMFVLNANEMLQLRQYFNHKRWPQRFDRVVFLLDPQLLYEQRHALKNIPHPVMMRFHYDNPEQERYTRLLLEAIPWMRWIGVNPAFSKILNELGYDAYAIKPLHHLDAFTPTLPPLVGESALQNSTKCHIFQGQSLCREVQVIARAPMPIKKALVRWDSDYSAYKEIHLGDIFVFWASKERYRPLPMIKAMARGAVVLTPSPGYHMCMYYGWQDNHNCLFMRSAENVLETVNILTRNRDLKMEIAQAAIETASHYSYSAVGRELGMCLMMPLREVNNYRQKIRFLGFRF